MPLPTTIGNQIVGSVGIPTGMLASDKNLVVLDADMAAHDEHDWCETGTSVPGVSAGGPAFPAGALLGWQPVGGGLGHMHAQSADNALAAYNASAQRMVYTWFSAVKVDRGVVGTATIPASADSLAVVLAKDVDITGTRAATGRMIVPVIWQGIFTPRGILQDKESYGAPISTPWPVVEGTCDRLEITVKPNWTHG